jgi:hypothetical protein
MTILRLHNNNDPTRLVLVKSDDISTVIPVANGSAIASSEGSPVYVHETPEEIADILDRLEDK